MELSKVLNEESCINGNHYRLPNLIQAFIFNESINAFEVEDVIRDNGVLKVRGNEYPIPDTCIYPTITFDSNGEYVITYMLNGKGCIDYMDNFAGKRELLEIEATSISCGISSTNTYKKTTTEVLVAYTNGKEVLLREQSSRFQTPSLYATLSNNTARIRVCGPTSSNRFLIRFFEKIKLVQ